MLIALALSLILVLSVLRHILEPACPSCEGKRWSSDSRALACTRCGWSSVAAAPAAPAPAVDAHGVAYPSGQYEIGFR